MPVLRTKSTKLFEAGFYELELTFRLRMAVYIVTSKHICIMSFHLFHLNQSSNHTLMKITSQESEVIQNEHVVSLLVYCFD